MGSTGCPRHLNDTLLGQARTPFERGVARYLEVRQRGRRRQRVLLRARMGLALRGEVLQVLQEGAHGPPGVLTLGVGLAGRRRLLAPTRPRVDPLWEQRQPTQAVRMKAYIGTRFSHRKSRPSISSDSMLPTHFDFQCSHTLMAVLAVLDVKPLKLL